MRMLRRLTLATGIAIVVAASPVMAQQGQQQAPMMGQGGMMGPGAGGMMGGCPMVGGMQGMMMGSGPMMEGGLAYQKAELGITEDQTAAWDDYAAAIKARGGA